MCDFCNEFTTYDTAQLPPNRNFTRPTAAQPARKAAQLKAEWGKTARKAAQPASKKVVPNPPLYPPWQLGTAGRCLRARRQAHC